MERKEETLQTALSHNSGEVMIMPKFVVQISKNGRYFEDSCGNPLFWLGDTQWNLFRCHTPDEADEILLDRCKKGFTFIQVMLNGVLPIIVPGCQRDAIYGEAFFDRNPALPNPVYFKNVDYIIKKAEDLGIVLVIGIDHPGLKLTNLSNARNYGHWLGDRYQYSPNIIWVASYYIPSGENLILTRELTAGLREGDGGSHLITCHPDPANPVATSGICHSEQWLDFNCIQTFRSIDLIYDSIITDYNRKPAKPVVLAEGAYEDGPEYGIDITARLIRQQAYLSYFSGGHHSFGHNDNWRVLPTWRASLDSPGSRQMAILRGVFSSVKWWEMQPDQSIFAADCVKSNISCKALRNAKGSFWMVYSSSSDSYAIRKSVISSHDLCSATWIDPRNGDQLAANAVYQENSVYFSCPSGWEDSLLLLGDNAE
jgi:hypothetical protein